MVLPKLNSNSLKINNLFSRQFSSVLNPKEAMKEDLGIKDKRLDDILKVDLVKDKSAPEVQAIWEEYHRNKEVISATIPKNLFVDIQTKMSKHPTFIFPLPRSQGYEFIMCQSFGLTVHFTPLLAYQVSNILKAESNSMVLQLNIYYL